MVGGFNGRVLVVDLTSCTYSTRAVEEGEFRRFLGARGLAAYWYAKEVAPSVPPLGAENRVYLVTGLLTGTPVPASTKLSLCTKSPETGHYTTSNSGGNFGPFLKRAGYDGLILTGAAETPVWLDVTEGEVAFHPAGDLWGRPVSETEAELRGRVPGSSVLAIGPAGERLVRFACVQVDGRSFGRGGAGAVLGSKKVKAITVRGLGEVPLADPEGLKAALPELITRVRDGKADLREYGTASLTETINSYGCYPTRNFQSAVFEGAEGLNAKTIKADYWVRNAACWRCPIACTKVCRTREGDENSDPEYESIWALGGHCGVGDFGAVIRANALCDDYGLDTMSGGYMVGLAMELFGKGLITREDTDGLDLVFGSPGALLGGLRLIGERVAIGDLLAEGVLGVQRVHPEWKPFLVHVKGSPFAAYDPRGFCGIGLSYGTSTRGACHNVGGWTIGDELTSGKMDRYAADGKAHLVCTLQDVRAYLDSLGLCTNARKPLGFTDAPREVVVKFVSGLDLTPDLMPVGARIYSLERWILNREGIRASDDQLPPRIMEEPLPEGPAQGRRLTPELYRRMLGEYYEERGWSPDGVVLPETLARLGLSELAEAPVEAVKVWNLRNCQLQESPHSFAPLREKKENNVLRDSFILLSPETCPTKTLTAGYTVIYPGCRTSGHGHAEYEEIYHIVRGQGVMRVGEQTFPIRAGDTFLVPFGLFHATDNPYRETLEYFWVISPDHVQAR